MLKRPDEKYVTERAYENPKFAEDLVRDVAADLNREPRVRSYVVEAENFERIHNHRHSPASSRADRPVFGFREALFRGRHKSLKSRIVA